MRVAALGRTRMLLDATRLLAARGHTVPLVVTCQPAPEYGVAETDFARLARELGAHFLQTQTLNRDDVVAQLRAASCDIALSVSWVNKVGSGAIAAFPFGILNLHGGDLPRYRGNAPFAWAILNGEQHVGLTVHLMDPADIDSGPVVRKVIIPISANTYVGDLYERLGRDAPALLVESAEGIVDGTITPVRQTGAVLRCYPRRPEDGRIDWRLAAADIGRLIRASAEPFSGAFCEYQGQRLVVWRGHPESWQVESFAVPGQVVARRAETGSIVVATGYGLVELQLVSFGEAHRVSPANVVRTLRDRLT